MAKKTEHQRDLHKEIISQMLTLSTSGFGLVAALAWNEVIKETIDTYIKPYFDNASGLISILIYAITVTVLAVVVTYQLSKLKEHLDRH